MNVSDSRTIVAIPIFEERVSPRCEHANRMIVLEMGGGKEISRSHLNLTRLNPLERINFIIEQDIDEFICTGISGFWRRMLEANHVRVVETTSFDVMEVIDRMKGGFLY